MRSPPLCRYPEPPAPKGDYLKPLPPPAPAALKKEDDAQGAWSNTPAGTEEYPSMVPVAMADGALPDLFVLHPPGAPTYRLVHNSVVYVPSGVV